MFCCRYVVSSGLTNHGRGGRQLGFSIRALSKTLGPDDIRDRVDKFLPQFREILASMPQEVLNKYRRTCIVFYSSYDVKYMCLVALEVIVQSEKNVVKTL